mgnify:CR=1 FL=1
MVLLHPTVPSHIQRPIVHKNYGNACIKKFDDYSETSIANRNSTCSMHDVVVARLGETYLIAAEDLFKKWGKTEEAAQNDQ